MNIKKYFYQKKYNCPLCEEDFISLKVKSSSLKKKDDDTDFCPYYEEMNPLYYQVIVCPNCGYSAHQDNFFELKEEDKKLLKDKVSGLWKEKDYTGLRDLEEAINCYRLALYCGQLKGLSFGSLASLSLRLAWLYRFKGDQKKEEKFLQYARDGFDKAYHHEDLPIGNIREDALTYLLGELSRRLGEYETAIKWFSRQIHLPKGKNRPLLEKRTREQWYLTQEERKKKRH